MTHNQEQSVYYVPGAIILAGVIIAGAVYFSNKGSGEPVAQKANTPAKTTVSAGIPSKILESEHVLGNLNAPVTIIEYSDTECPFCKRHQTSMNTLMDTYGKDGKVAWVYRHFPLDALHSKARKEAEATECAAELGGNTKFWAMINAIYTNTPGNNGLDAAQLPIFAKQVGLDVSKFNTCLSSGKMAATVDAQAKDGAKAGARGTPYSVMMLKNTLSKSQESAVTSFVTQSGLTANVTISSDKNRIVLNGALPLAAITGIIDAIEK